MDRYVIHLYLSVDARPSELWEYAAKMKDWAPINSCFALSALHQLLLPTDAKNQTTTQNLFSFATFPAYLKTP
jgi:hypothetical protein